MTPDVTLRTFLHDIRDIRSAVALAAKGLRQRSGFSRERRILLAELEDFDYRLLRLYRRERVGPNKEHYDGVLRAEDEDREA